MLLIIAIVSYFKECPEPKIVYRDVVVDQREYLYSDANLPSNVYKDLFIESSPWIGNFKLGNGRTFLQKS